ncbi:ATP-binding protein [Methylocella sp.]|uniref:ATP-binding protein n=1 Tax=Methylocella sp. TaxID=1978226 RepID=UPI0037852D26
MTGIRFSPDLGEADAAKALRELSPRLSADTPILALGGAGEGAPRALFASEAVLRLFGAPDLEALSRAFREDEPSDAPARRLAGLAAAFPVGGPARLERLRFQGIERPIIFLCRRLRAGGGKTRFLAAALDMPNAMRSRPAALETKAFAAPAALPPPAAPARFLWRAGPDDLLVDVGAALAEALDEPRQAFTGQKLARLVGAFDADRGMELQRLFDARSSWSGVEVDWPSADDRTLARVSLAGSPMFDGARRFLGFRGFGLVLSRRDGPAAGLSGDAPTPADGENPALAALRRRLDAAYAPDADAPGQAGPGAAAPASALSAQARAGFDALPIGVLAAQAGAPIFANRLLLDFVGCADLRSARLAGAFDTALARGLALAPGAEELATLPSGGRELAATLRRETLACDGGEIDLLTFAPQPRAASRGEERVAAEARRSQREARELNAILDTAMDGVAVLDADGRVERLNRSAEALFGVEAAEIAGQDFSVLVAPESRERAKAYFEGLKPGGAAGVFNDGREILGLTRRGGVIPMFMTLGRIGGGGGRRYCALMRDMTHWKKIERELKDARSEAERASALKSDFLAKVSHEIRTPLNAIIGFAEVMLEERFGPVANPRYKDYLKDIHSSGSLVMSLVNDLLDLSKIEAGKMDLSFAAADLNRIVAECVSIMQPQASGARVVIGLSLAPQLPQIWADERSVRQIALNLLSNAIKFTDGGGQVVVSTALSDENCAALRVRDTGVGMSSDDLEVALRPFGQAGRGRASGGTGLGLPLTKALVEANRASFSIRSKPEEGTLVEIVFPPARVVAARK